MQLQSKQVLTRYIQISHCALALSKGMMQQSQLLSEARQSLAVVTEASSRPL